MKAQRLIQLIMLINAKRTFTVQELADEFGLSSRTITRDLQELSELGVPLYSVQGRGGGYRLLRERILPPITFTEHEAVAMFIAFQSLDYFGALPFDEGAGTALHKFYHYLPADIKEQIDRLKDRVAVWSPQRRMSSECLRTLLQAVMLRSVVTIVYASSHGIEERDIQPIGLYASSGFWYCPAYCFQRQAFRLFRADRIQSASLNREIPPRVEVAGWTLWTTPMNPEREQITFTVRLTPQGVRLLESDRFFGSSIRQLEDGSGEASILVPIENLSFYTDLIWRLGEEALIVEPPQAVDLITAKLNALSARYNVGSAGHQNS